MVKTGTEILAEAIAQHALSEIEVLMAYPVTASFPVESPIERLFYTAVVWFDRLCPGYSADIGALQLGEPKEPGNIGVEFQKEILTWRVDFLFTVISESGVTTRLVVECDGHDFHERTKEQAKRDRSRDRALQEAGFTVFRFTGSEIYRDAWACATQVYRWAQSAYHHRPEGLST